jgi:hypothetical protein
MKRLDRADNRVYALVFTLGQRTCDCMLHRVKPCIHNATWNILYRNSVHRIIECTNIDIPARVFARINQRRTLWSA